MYYKILYMLSLYMEISSANKKWLPVAIILLRDISNAKRNYQVVFKNSCPLISIVRLEYLMRSISTQSWNIMVMMFSIFAVAMQFVTTGQFKDKMYRTIIGISLWTRLYFRQSTAFNHVICNTCLEKYMVFELFLIH